MPAIWLRTCTLTSVVLSSFHLRRIRAMQSLSAVRTVIFVLLFGVVLSLEMQAQNAAVSGTITDSTGAVVSGVQVTVRNLATNLSRTTSSSATGAYSVTNLEVGAYEITAKKDGFRTFHL